MKVWHFSNGEGTLQYRHNGVDGVQIKPGETLRAEGYLMMCVNGMHGSVKAIDALHYAPFSHEITVWRCNISGESIHGEDKVCARERTPIWGANCTRTLKEFAIWCAERAQRYVEKPLPESLEAIRVAKLSLEGKATKEECRNAAAAATAAAHAAAAAAYAAAAAAHAAAAAAYAAADAAYADGAAKATATAAAHAAADAAYADGAAKATAAAAAAAANRKERKAQNRKLTRMLNDLREETGR